MSEAEIASKIVAALGAAADGAAGVRAPLVSVEITWLTPAPLGRVEASLVRKTRTLVFMSADAIAADGARIATAASVHKMAG
jgi:hypothetical protein